MNITGIHHVTLIVDDFDRATWFYGDVLGLEERGRPDFDFPGIFYRTGDGQEIHLIVAARQLGYEPLYIRRRDGSEVTFRHIHRHAALRTSDLPGWERRLEEAGVNILFSESNSDTDDPTLQAAVEGFRVVYGGIPIFCEDPFGNIIELVPLAD
jgi:catechol 2,3-dioxygenase-like lactoylglutathione lyase family enzyme